MKKLILIFQSIFLSLVLMAQSDMERMGDSAFAMGNYADAVELYDAAITLSGTPGDRLLSKQDKASRCLALKKSGDRFYSSGAYAKSKTEFQKLLSINPSDKYPAEMFAKIDAQLARVAARAAEKKKADKVRQAYYDALKGEVDDIKQFCLTYPDSEYIGRAKALIRFVDESLLPSDESEVELYKIVGRDFKKVGDIGSARVMFECAALAGDAEAFYEKALTYDNLTANDPKNLLFISAGGGYSPAISRLADILGHSNYNKEAAGRLYENIVNVYTDLRAFVYVYENSDYYPVQILKLKEIAGNNWPEFYSNAVSESDYDDNLLFQFASILKELNVGQPDVFFKLAAQKGNTDAVRKVLSGDELNTYERFLKRRTDTFYRSYLKYMLQKPVMSADDWYGVRFCTSDRHEELLSMALGDMRYGFQYKDFTRLLRSYDTWDKVVVDKILNSVGSMSPKYARKITKKISSVKKMTGLYDINANPLYRIVQAGCCDYPHNYVQAVGRENLWGTSRPSSSSSGTKETKPEYTVDVRIMEYLRQRGGSISVSTVCLLKTRGCFLT